MERVCIFGGGGHASVIIDILVQMGCYEVAGVIDLVTPKKSIPGEKFLGVQSQLPLICKKHDISKGIIGVGDNSMRLGIQKDVLSMIPDFEFVSAVHPKAIISPNSSISNGCAIMAGAIINSSVTVGEHSIVNTNASVDHDSIIGSFASIGPGAILGGHSTIGDLTQIGIGSIIENNIKIGRNSMIGSGSLVRKDAEENAVYFGIPAKFIRSR